LDPTTGLVVRGSPRLPAPAAAAASGGALYVPAGQVSPPPGMGQGHGTPPGHVVFAPGALHAQGAPPYASYSPAVGPDSANGSGSGIVMDPYAGPAGAGMIAAGTMGAAAAAAAAAAARGGGGYGSLQYPGTIPAAIPHHMFGNRPYVTADSEVSSMFSNASSVGEPLQPQHLPPVTWPAEAMPSPTGSGSMQSSFGPFNSAFIAGAYDLQGREMQGTPQMQPGRPALETSEGGAAGAATGGAGLGVAGAAVAAGAAALAAGVAVAGSSKQGKQGGSAALQAPPTTADQQTPAGLKIDTTGGSSRSKAAAGDAAVDAQLQKEGKAAGGPKRKSGLGGLFGETHNACMVLLGYLGKANLQTSQDQSCLFSLPCCCCCCCCRSCVLWLRCAMHVCAVTLPY
jgi:hypothetical protein